MFLHRHDDVIQIDDLQMTLEEFLGYEPEYADLPSGITSRVYLPGVRHALSDGSHEVGGPIPWVEGDRYLARRDEYAKRHAEHAARATREHGGWPSPTTRVDVGRPRIEEMGYFGNVWVRKHHYAKAGETHAGHTHEFDHVSFLTSGRVAVQVRETETIFEAPTFVVIKKGERHQITALEDGTTWWCVFALRDLDGQVLDVFDPDKHAPRGIL